MSPEVSDLLKRALSLPAEERAAPANTLLDSIEPAQDSVEEAWDKEVARRMKDLEAGRAVTVPWEELRRSFSTRWMSDSRVVYHEGAAADVRQALAWYQKRNPKAALDFINEINRAGKIISELPSVGR